MTNKNGIARIIYSFKNSSKSGKYFIKSIFEENVGYVRCFDTILLKVGENLTPRSNRNKTPISTNNVNAGVSMKKTRMPISILLTLLFSTLGWIFRKKQS